MEKQWYFNTVTEQPELGMVSPASHRMGPYKTREDALDAWKIVQERNLNDHTILALAFLLRRHNSRCLR